MVILELRRVSFSYNTKTFISDLNLQLREKEFVGLIGPNGSGKTTILKLLAGLLKPDDGEVLLWGKPLQQYRGRDRAKLMSYMPQVLYTDLPFTVKEVVSMGLYPYETLPPMSIDEALQMVGLDKKADSLLTELSGGEKRRVFIAMTLLQGAGILLLDEPLANLDIRYQVEMIHLLRYLKQKKDISIIMAIHDINLLHMFDRIVVINHGEVITTGPPAEVITESLLKEVYGVHVKLYRQADGSLLIGILK